MYTPNILLGQAHGSTEVTQNCIRTDLLRSTRYGMGSLESISWQNQAICVCPYLDRATASLVSFSLCTGFEFKMRNRHGSCVGSKEILLSFHKPIKQWNGMAMSPLFFSNWKTLKLLWFYLAVLGENALEAACRENPIEKECSGLSCCHSSAMGWLISLPHSPRAQRYLCAVAQLPVPHKAGQQLLASPHSLCCALLCSLLLAMQGHCTCIWSRSNTFSVFLSNWASHISTVSLTQPICSNNFSQMDSESFMYFSRISGCL